MVSDTLRLRVESAFVVDRAFELLPYADSGLAALLNHLLRRESWPCERLRAYAGKTVHFRLPLLNLCLTVRDSGEIGAAAADAHADTTLTIPPAVLPRLLARDDAALRQIEISGDTDFAETIFYLFQHLRWDVEEDLSRVIGDIAAHRLAQIGKRFAAWPPQAAENIARAFAEYWTEERPLLAKPMHVAQWMKGADTLRDDVERLEKRIARLAQSPPRAKR